MVALCRSMVAHPQTCFARKLSAFVELPPEVVAALDRLQKRSRTVAAGTPLLAQGYRPERLSILTDGWAIRYKLLADGRRAIVEFIVPGDIVGLRAHVLQSTFGSVETVGPCGICTVDPLELLELFGRPPLANGNVFLALALERTLLSERLATMARQSAYERLSYLFVDLLGRLTAVGLADGNSYDMPVTQEILADAVGLSEVHVNRTLKRLRGERLVTFKRPRVIIHDLAALSKAADSGEWNECAETGRTRTWLHRPFLVAEASKRWGSLHGDAYRESRHLRELADVSAG